MAGADVSSGWVCHTDFALCEDSAPHQAHSVWLQQLMHSTNGTTGGLMLIVSLQDNNGVLVLLKSWRFAASR